jgi:hypothetical protein
LIVKLDEPFLILGQLVPRGRLVELALDCGDLAIALGHFELERLELGLSGLVLLVYLVERVRFVRVTARSQISQLFNLILQIGQLVL